MDTIPSHAPFQQELSFTDPVQRTKRCSKCHQIKSFSSFNKRKERKIGVSSQCKQCVAAPKEKQCVYCHEMKSLSDFLRANTTLDKNTCLQCLLPLRERKECTMCHQIKPIEAFKKRNDRKVGISTACKDCLNAADRETNKTAEKQAYNRRWQREFNRNHPEYARNQSLKKLYGITIIEYDAMLLSQGGVCKVCAGPPLGKGRYHVDHDHITGRIRGLLCHKCNVALGMVQDDIQHLKALITYLEEVS